MGLSDEEQMKLSCNKEYAFVGMDISTIIGNNTLYNDLLVHFIKNYTKDLNIITRDDIDNYYSHKNDHIDAGNPVLLDRKLESETQPSWGKYRRSEMIEDLQKVAGSRQPSLLIEDDQKVTGRRMPSSVIEFSKDGDQESFTIHMPIQDDPNEADKMIEQKILNGNYLLPLHKNLCNIYMKYNKYHSSVEKNQKEDSKGDNGNKGKPLIRGMFEKMFRGDDKVSISDVMSIIDSLNEESTMASLVNETYGSPDNDGSETKMLTDIKSDPNANDCVNEISKEELDGESKEEPKQNSQKTYECKLCSHTFCSKQRLVNHIENGKRCKYNQKMKKIEDIQKQVTEHQSIKSSETGTHIHNSMVNCGNTYNIQNIHNIQNQTINNNTNLSNSNYLQVKLRDFINEGYNYDHVTKEDMKDEDFYLIKNFMRSIMKNDENKNIIFNKKNAIIFSGEGLHEIKKEDACMMVMDKLEECIEALMNREDADLEDIKKDILRYYSVMKLKYKCDTWHKTYDPHTRTFDNILHKGCLWTRDVCINELEKVCSDFEEIVNKIFYDKGIKSNKRISTIPVTIYGMVPRRSRYKPEKDEY